MKITYPQLCFMYSLYTLCMEKMIFQSLKDFFPLGCSQKAQGFKLAFHGSIDHSRPGRFKHLMSQSRLNGR